jgi:hypothetical protein
VLRAAYLNEIFIKHEAAAALLAALFVFATALRSGIKISSNSSLAALIGA